MKLHILSSIILLGLFLVVLVAYWGLDTAYDGQVFNIAHSDVPPEKSDLVAGHYELLAPDGPTTVAVKIVDMLGEEVLATADV